LQARFGNDCNALHMTLHVTTKLQPISIYLLGHLEGHNAPYVVHSDSFEVGSDMHILIVHWTFSLVPRLFFAGEEPGYEATGLYHQVFCCLARPQTFTRLWVFHLTIRNSFIAHVLVVGPLHLQFN